NEDYSRGMAADNMAQYNRSTSLAASQWADTYRADQQNAAWGRDTDMYSAGRQFSNDYTTNEANRLGATRQTTATNYGRDQDTLTAWSGLNDKNLNAGNQVLDRSDAAWDNWTGLGIDTRNASLATGIARSNANNPGNVLDALKTIGGDRAAQDAINAVRNAPKEDQGLLGGLFGSGSIKWI
ncbi:MAG: hypothetical protein JXB36_02925, partial [Gammaproteobacteria bacterium]|nr:hypothetical protein [Gammaproteobacteria bacterium]